MDTMFQTLLGPIVFATLAGAWIYRHRPAQRGALLWNLVLIFVVAALGMYLQPSAALFYLTLPYALFLTFLMVWPGRAAMKGANLR